MKDRFDDLRIAGICVVIIITVILIYPSVPYLQYTHIAEKFPSDQSNLSAETINTSVETNDNIRAIEDFSTNKQTIIERTLAAPDHTITVSANDFESLNVEFVVSSGILYDVSLRSENNQSHITLQEVSGKAALDVLSIPIGDFRDEAYLPIWESDRSVILTTIRRGKYQTARYVTYNNTLVRYQGNYYNILIMQPHQ